MSLEELAQALDEGACLVLRGNTASHWDEIKATPSGYAWFRNGHTNGDIVCSTWRSFKHFVEENRINLAAWVLEDVPKARVDPCYAQLQLVGN